MRKPTGREDARGLVACVGVQPGADEIDGGRCFVVEVGAGHRSSSLCNSAKMRRPIQRTHGTAHELPSAL